MRIAFLCKRQYMGKDVIADRYARLYEIPLQLARLGHDVLGLCLSYQRHDEGRWEHDTDAGRLAWESRSPRRIAAAAMALYPRQLLRRLAEFKPDVLIGASDIPHVAMARWASRRLGVPYAADLYDNFEGFGQGRIPGMVPLLRSAVRQAALVTTTSEPLKELVECTYHARGEVMAMPSTIDKQVFRTLDRPTCRRELRLPEDAWLVGTAGVLSRAKGLATLYAAWPSIADRHPDAHLVLAGPVESNCPLPPGPRVHHLGSIAHARTAVLFNALDLGVICIRDTTFGRYCFPQKSYEMIACGLPVVSARVGAMTALLHDTPDSLYTADDAADLARAVSARREDPRPARVRIDDWSHIIALMERRLCAIVGSTPPSR